MENSAGQELWVRVVAQHELTLSFSFFMIIENMYIHICCMYGHFWSVLFLRFAVPEFT